MSEYEINIDTHSGIIGGITGDGSSGIIMSCSNSGKIKAVANVHSDGTVSMSSGGIAGYIYSARIDRCVNNGEINASTSIYRKKCFLWKSINKCKNTK